MVCQYILLRPVLLLVIINRGNIFDGGCLCEGGEFWLIFCRPLLDTTLDNEYIKRVKNNFNYILCKEYHVCVMTKVSLQVSSGIYLLPIFMKDYIVRSRNQAYEIWRQGFLFTQWE